jgi:hypothetical protein
VSEEEPTLKEIAADLRQLKHEVQSHGNMLGLMMYSQSTAFADRVIADLLDDPVLLEIFARVDGIVTKDDLAKSVVAMAMKNGGRSSVYARFQKLQNLGIVELATPSGTTAVYKKSTVAANLRIEHDPALAKALKARKRVV